ncbi:sulfide dehydrogenase (flavocytochrome), flavoprotein subunit [Magnetococcus marinus MC-1]|uniref:Sulfide dehydrogenase (Flavocytochrome), flavoprotein subunit n=1 Tax=Magnetococcus marinus (strain ATCC BAA-1437 / JCM 17883 / MC-1) TaxID=156889 RepID=A0LBZ4_MAGMM|nr:NAD(P)/FAD-dependent oxidoreductase [Magnetococcus marinus]ABK45487.1 sulfide dehydrogenase (flavocytochrome), flavoprotein subunit [Magnetococcus marinus MC-1]
MSKLTRRNFIKTTGAAAAVGAMGVAAPAIANSHGNHVVVVGGGYGGAVAAKYIRMADPTVKVTLIEQNEYYYSCPLSNPVIIGIRDMEVQKWGYDGLKKHGIDVVIDTVTGIDAGSKTVTTKGGKFKYTKLVLSPGVEFNYAAIPGLTKEIAHTSMPHAWKAGPQTLLLRDKLAAMKDGEPFVMVAPPNPFRCPPGPYERASLVAHYLKKHKPKSKVIILDPKDKFSKMGLFRGGWKELGYEPNYIEWIPAAEGGKVTKVDAATGTVYTDMGEYKSSCINIIPPMTAGSIAVASGLTDKSGWCPVDLKTFESTLAKDVYVIGDSSAAAGLPKSGYAANSEAKVAAAAVVAALQGKPAPMPSYVNTCYSLLAPDYGISVALVSVFEDGKITKKSGGLSPSTASKAHRKQEAFYAESWYQSIMADTFA